MKWIRLVLMICLSLAISGLVAARTSGKSTKPPAAKTESAKKDFPLYGQVIACTDQALTIKGAEGKEDHKYTMTPETKIVKDEKPATVADVKPGLWVGGYLHKNADGGVKVLKVNLSVKQKEAKPAAKPDVKAPAPKK